MVSLACLLFAMPPADAGLTAAVSDHLARAADALDRRDFAAAVGPLRAHLKLHPDQVSVRVTLADVLWKTDPAAAGAQYTAIISAAQPMTGPPRRALPHCHTRLMKLAAARGRDDEEQFHRGAALYWLSVELEPKDAVEAAGVRLLAAAALREATDESNPRPWVYLAEIAAAQGQVSAAKSAARRAATCPPYSLTDYEQDLLMARR